MMPYECFQIAILIVRWFPPLRVLATRVIKIFETNASCLLGTKKRTRYPSLSLGRVTGALALFSQHRVACKGCCCKERQKRANLAQPFSMSFADTDFNCWLASWARSRSQRQIQHAPMGSHSCLVLALYHIPKTSTDNISQCNGSCAQAPPAGYWHRMRASSPARSSESIDHATRAKKFSSFRMRLPKHYHQAKPRAPQ
eukprot:675618-Amphidinium_carterae.1